MSGYPYGQFNEDHVYASHTASPQQQQQPQLQQFQQQHQQPPQEPPGAYPQWETLEQLEHQHRQPQDMEMPMHSPLDLDLTPMPTPTSASFQSRPLEINLDDPRHMVPTQASPINNSPIHLVDPHLMQQQALAHQRHQLQQQHQLLMSRPGSSTGPLLFSDPVQPPTPGPSTGANLPGTAGAMRSSSTRGRRAAETHPYYRHSPAPPPPGGVAAFLLGSSSAAPPPTTSASSSKNTSTTNVPPRARKPSVRFSESQPDKLPNPLSTGMAPRPKSSRSQAKGMPSPSVPPIIRLPFTGTSTDAQQPTSPSSFGAQGTAHSPQTHSPLSRTPIDASSFTQRSPSILQGRSPLGNPPPNPFPPPRSHPTSPTFKIGSSSGSSSMRAGTQKTPLRHIPADMYYSLSTRTLSASLEVPGVARENVRVTMGTCYFNRIKYVCVVAESDPVFPWATGMYEAPGNSGKRTVAPVREEEEEEGESEAGGSNEKRPESSAPTQTTAAESESTANLKAESPERATASTTFSIPKFPGLGKLINPNLRERRFGISRRVIQVPTTTTPQDIEASLQDGVLTLTIHCGEPFEGDDELVIPVR